MLSRPVCTVTVNVLLALIACAPSVDPASIKTTTVPLVDQLTPRPADHPILFFHGTEPQCPFEEVGLVGAEGPMHGAAAVETALKTEARRLGADAVVHLTTDTQARVHRPLIMPSLPSYYLAGTAVAFVDSDCKN